MAQRTSDMWFHQDLGMPRPAQAPCTRGYCGPRSLAQPQPHGPYPYNLVPYLHGPPTYYPRPGPSGQPTGVYGQGPVSHSQLGLCSGQGHYGQRARPLDPQLVPSDQHGWPIRQEEDWGEAVVYCPQKAPCFQRGTHHCQALLGQKSPHG